MDRHSSILSSKRDCKHIVIAVAYHNEPFGLLWQSLWVLYSWLQAYKIQYCGVDTLLATIPCSHFFFTWRLTDQQHYACNIIMRKKKLDPIVRYKVQSTRTHLCIQFSRAYISNTTGDILRYPSHQPNIATDCLFHLPFSWLWGIPPRFTATTKPDNFYPSLSLSLTNLAVFVAGCCIACGWW